MFFFYFIAVIKVSLVVIVFEAKKLLSYIKNSTQYYLLALFMNKLTVESFQLYFICCNIIIYHMKLTVWLHNGILFLLFSTRTIAGRTVVRSMAMMIVVMTFAAIWIIFVG
jgi:hypothetical protein